MSVAAVRNVVHKWIGIIRNVLSPKRMQAQVIVLPVRPAEREITQQSKDHVIRLSYRKKKSQQQNWRKWKRG